MTFLNVRDSSELSVYASTDFLSYLFVFFEGSLCCAQVDLQLFPPVLLLSETGLEQSQSLLAAVPQLFGVGQQERFTVSVGQVPLLCNLLRAPHQTIK